MRNPTKAAWRRQGCRITLR